MPVIAVDGDMTNVHAQFVPGTASATQSSFTVAGKPVLRVGDPISDHVFSPDPKVKHVGVTIAAGTGSFTIAGKAVARISDAASCGGKLAVAGVASFSVGG